VISVFIYFKSPQPNEAALATHAEVSKVVSRWSVMPGAPGSCPVRHRRLQVPKLDEAGQGIPLGPRLNKIPISYLERGVPSVDDGDLQPLIPCLALKAIELNVAR
jgi:hypothetical protein